MGQSLSVYHKSYHWILNTQCHISWRIKDQLDVTSYYVLFHFFYAQHVLDINTSIIGSHTETPTHMETRTHDQCGDTIEKSQAPDDGCINVQNMLKLNKT